MTKYIVDNSSDFLDYYKWIRCCDGSFFVNYQYVDEFLAVQNYFGKQVQQEQATITTGEYTA
mgnify:CR=1 FL=1